MKKQTVTNVVAKPMTLKEIFKHMIDLSEKGMLDSTAFDQSMDEYLSALQTASNSEKQEAVAYLKSEIEKGTDPTGMSLENIVEIIEEKITVLDEAEA